MTSPAAAPAHFATDFPLLASEWDTPFGLPPFAALKPEDFPVAFECAMAAHREEIASIRDQMEPPSFENTVAALERSGRLLDRTASIFFNLASAHTNEALQAVEREVAPRLAAHENAILQDSALFARLDALYAKREVLGLDDEQRRVLDLHHLAFVRAGARLDPAAKARAGAIQERLAALATRFAQNVLKDEQSWQLVLEGEADLAGLPSALISAASHAAASRGLAGKYVITLARSSVEPFLQFSSRRDLREQVFLAWTRRGESGGETGNRALLAEIAALRAEFARLLGYANYAEYSLAETMAKTPEAARGLLSAVWPKALRKAAGERAALVRHIAAEGGNYQLAAWDWRYLAEKERQARYGLDEAEVRPYFPLEAMITAAFDTASRLFGLSFHEVHGLNLYHEDVRAWEVRDERGASVGLFLGDYFARPTKRSGAWMSHFRHQQKLDGSVRPIVVNVLNFTRGAEGEPSLLSFDDARTLFHEFGHGLHGLLSDVTYPSISGTRVVRDFVELPSQLFENWLLTPEVLKRFARHATTGEPIPDRLIERIQAARTFNQGFATVEYAACAFADLDLHSLTEVQDLDVTRFEQETLARLGMPEDIVMRHRLPHFLHLTGGYAAGYYSYLWSEVLDASAFAAFSRTGDIFHRETAKRLYEYIYSAGNRRDPEAAYLAFHGGPADLGPLLEKRGLAV